jgi:CRP-like cAMP-binding protein
MYIENLITYFNGYVSLDSHEKEDLRSRVIEKSVKRKQFILQKDDVCRHYNFVVEGLFKMYAVDKFGIEHNIQFALENEWIEDLISFHHNKPSLLYIEAIEPSIVIQIEKSNLLYLFSRYPKFDRNFRVITENKFMKLENRVLQNISSNAEEKYQDFIETYPKLSQRLPNTQIASYLGITPEFLSKIRSNFSKKQTNTLNKFKSIS